MWSGIYEKAYGSSKSRGVVIIISKKVFKINFVRNDTKWWYKEHWEGDYGSSFSRIDYMFVSNILMLRINKTEVGLICVTGHALINVDVKIRYDHKARIWRLDTYIPQQKKVL